MGRVPAQPDAPLPPLIDALTAHADEIALTQDAVHASAQECMSSKGFQYDVAAYAGPDEGLGWLGEWFGPGLTPELAAARGYRQPEQVYDVPAAERSNPAATANADRARRDASYEHAMEACTLAALTAVFGPTSESFSELQSSTTNQLIPVLSNVKADARYRKAEARWKACMTAAGLDDSTPRGLAPNGSAVGSPPAAPATAEERQRAVTDATCRAAAGLQSALRQSATDLVDQWLTTRPGLVEQLRAARSAMVDRSRAILNR